MNQHREPKPDSFDYSNILLLTNHFFQWAGSETIIVELSEFFVSKGCFVTVYANDVDSGFAADALSTKCRLELDPDKIDLSKFDLVYCQHQVITRFLDQLISLPAAKRPKVIYAHLSPYEPIELPGPAIEPYFSEVVVYNSPETGAEMRNLGLSPDNQILMPNPAPDAFFDSDYRAGKLKTLLIVSNHVPKELLKAISLVKRHGVKITIRGVGAENRRILPSDINQHDAVVSIGKTVQYSLAAGRPVYVYDRFGGPGWLLPENTDKAAWYNFSGRCCNRKLTAKEIASEILKGFEAAQGNCEQMRVAAERYRLSTWIEEKLVPALNARSGQRSDPQAGVSAADEAAMRREKILHLLAVDGRRRSRGTEFTQKETLENFAKSKFARFAISCLSRLGPRASRRGFRRLRKELKRGKSTGWG